MQEIELSAGIIEYEDTGGSGPVVVLLHGLVMDGSLWRHVVRELRADHRCLVPTFPLGGHRHSMRADADLSLRGIGRLQAEFLEALELRDVTLVGNDSGIFLSAAGEHPERIARLVITSCEAFDNFPPSLPGFAVALAAKLPGGVNALAQPMRLRVLRRLPFAFG
jgi:pimeloyl-ACP methyl ester carboxylesterase